MATTATRADPCSCATKQACYVKHASIKWDVDFNTKVITASVDYTIHIAQANPMLMMDARDIAVSSISVRCANAVPHTATKQGCAAFGDALAIDLSKVDGLVVGTDCILTIAYKTSPECSALQWLGPSQTAGKKQPYMFSQCQAIHARSLLPCQDTPSIKITYDAEVTVPDGLVALMSAVQEDGGAAKPAAQPGKRVYRFKQKVPIPTYLLAIAVGALESRTVGPRSAVWSEKEMVEAAAYEFADTEKMIQTAESIMGPYVWGRYDMLVLPPSFPFGGMENPCLTFVTPTVLAGDRSLASVIAHEISHSWTGNLATNTTWQHFWLNEGHTTYLEYLICGKLENSEQHRQFLAFNGWKGLEYAVEQVGKTHAYTQLVVPLENCDPDDAFSAIPYIKGFTLLYYLETKVGGPEVMGRFVRAVVEKFAYKTFTSEEWKQTFLDHFSELDKQGSFKDVDWQTWLYKPGMPPVHPDYDQTQVKACTDLCNVWATADQAGAKAFKKEAFQALSPMQRVEFLVQLEQKPALPVWKVEAMESVYDLNAVKNSEIRFAWLRVCLKAHWEASIPLAIDFATSQGRMKFTRPIFKDLYAWEHARGQAIDAFKAHRPAMHLTTAGLVAKDLKLAA